MIARLLFWVTANCPARLIKISGQPYLERYYVGYWSGRYWYLHRFVRNDREREVHDHPWKSAISFVLAGKYTEARCALTGDYPLMEERVVRWINRIMRRRDRIDLHRITSVEPETWTLFGHTEWEYPWGFYDIKEASITYREYKKKPGDPDDKCWWLTAPMGKRIGREPLRI